MTDKLIQYIIVRSDLNLSPGKLAAQVAHASLGSVVHHLGESQVMNWFDGEHTKVILRVKSLSALANLITELETNGVYYHAVYDSCLTELTPETNRGTLTCVGIKPYLKSVIHPLVSKYQLY